MTNTPRVDAPERRQVRLLPACVDQYVSDDHVVRSIWSYVELLDLHPFYATIRSVEGHAGRPAIDPRLLLALWIYATTEGIGSARRLAELCTRDLAYLWLCGGVTPSYHTLADFRSQNAKRFEDLLVAHVSGLLAAGIVQLKQVVQDGVRVRASAGSSSFRRKTRLQEFEVEAREQVDALAKELEDDPAATTRREAAARTRAAAERTERVQAALRTAEERERQQLANGTHKSKREQAAKRRKLAKGDVRASTTDPDAHPMKMGDGGYRPAYNAQTAVDPESRMIVSVRVTMEGTDGSMLPPMAEQIRTQYGEGPEEMVADGGFVTKKALEALGAAGVKVYAPVDKPRNNRDPFQPLKRDTPALAEWRMRMGTEAARRTYARRTIVEWVYARFRNRGLTRLPVRTTVRVSAVIHLHALTHNYTVDIARRAKLSAAA